jgi:hypothetical protein
MIVNVSWAIITGIAGSWSAVSVIITPVLLAILLGVVGVLADVHILW